MYVDACAIVALLSLEESADAYGAALDAADQPWTSALAAFEAVLVLSRPEKLNQGYPETEALVSEFLGLRGVALLSPGDAKSILGLAVSAAARHGVGRRRLSSFDCFHYAFAKSEDSALLTMDEALRETDVETLP